MRIGITSARAGLIVLALVALVAAGCSIIIYPSPGQNVTPAAPLTVAISAHPKGVLVPPETPIAGEGQLTLNMSAPGTSWASATDTSVVAEAAIDGGVPQTFVLFAGAARNNYTGFTGPLATGPHELVVSVRADLSPTSGTPTISMGSIDLSVVPDTDPGYRAIAHAPVLYGRGVNAHSDTPLFQFADDSPAAGGGRRIEYTTTWSNEDAGTGIAPVLLWGGYGRTTDIETTAIVNLDATGVVTSATYNVRGVPPDFPENQVGLDHSYATFGGTYFAGHPVLRVATGNNVLKDAGTTAFRFQQGLVAGPAAGQTRESAMDPIPVGYRVMGEEMQREQAGYTTNPLSIAAGDARQYAIVDLDTAPVDTKAVGVELQVTGDAHWYQNDLASAGSPVFYTGGHSRTAVKLPLDWHGKAITGARVRLYPTTPAPPTPPTITVNSFRVLEIRNDYATTYRSVPVPSVVVNP